MSTHLVKKSKRPVVRTKLGAGYCMSCYKHTDELTKARAADGNIKPTCGHCLNSEMKPMTVNEYLERGTGGFSALHRAGE